MSPAARVLAIGASVALLIPICGFAPDTAQSAGAKIDADIIVTAAPVYEPLAALRGEERFPKGAQLLLIHAAKWSRWWRGLRLRRTRMSPSTARRCSLRASRAAGDSWQIWEFTLADRSVRKVIATASDYASARFICRADAWSGRSARPGDFNWSPQKTAIRRHRALESDTRPGMLPLTYMQASAFPADVLADGRILFEAGFPLGSGSTPEIYLVYADGSGVESYRCDHGRARWGGRQLATRRRGLHAWRFVGSVYFAAGARGACRSSSCRICGSDCGDGIGGMAG